MNLCAPGHPAAGHIKTLEKALLTANKQSKEINPHHVVGLILRVDTPPAFGGVLAGGEDTSSFSHSGI